MFTARELMYSTEMEEIVDNDDYGRPSFGRKVYNCFNNADLDGTSFKHCDFENADFRLAVNIETADFTDATGLESCIFDDDKTKDNVLAQSKGSAG